MKTINQMKIIIITTLILSILFFAGCTTCKKLSAMYSDGNNIELRFLDKPNKFEYYFRSEMGVLEYSNGSWQLEKGKLELSGFKDDNINALNVKSVINKNEDNRTSRIEIHYNTDRATTNIKSVILINGNNIYTIIRDTVFSPDYKVETIQVKSYLSYTGLPSSSPKIDTLYSSKMNIGDGANETKNVVLEFTVQPYDFVRVKLNETLLVKNCRTLYLSKAKLKKFAK